PPPTARAPRRRHRAVRSGARRTAGHRRRPDRSGGARMTTTPAPPTTTPSPTAPAGTGSAPAHRRVADLAAAHIVPWQEGYMKDRTPAVAALARLRRGAGRQAGEPPDLWSLIDTQHLPAHTDGSPPPA